MGGDEFIVIIDDCHEPSRLRIAAEQILSKMEEPFSWEGQGLVPHVTIGGALFGRDGSDMDTLRQNADLALYASKQRGRGCYGEYGQHLRDAMMRRVRWVSELDAALKADRIVPYYQPIVTLSCNEIVGLEALARLQTKDGSIVSAGYFQDALNEPRIARRLTDLMLTKVAEDMRRWMQLGTPFERVAINVTAADFQAKDFPSRVASVFDGAGVPLSRVVLEVTETILVRDSDCAVANAVRTLRERGLRVALDDFGTGFASLTHLLTFPVDIIKIDRSFVARLMEDKTAGAIIGALVDIGRTLGVELVIEGVETPEQSAMLQGLGCVLGQGFLYAKPDTADVTTQRLRDWSADFAEGSSRIRSRDRFAV